MRQIDWGFALGSAFVQSWLVRAQIRVGLNPCRKCWLQLLRNRLMSFRQVFPLNLFRRMVCCGVALLSICATTVQAATVFQDNFNRVGTLNGSTPSFTAGSNWTAHPGFSTDGTKVSAAFGLFDFKGAAYVPLPVAITS